MDLSLFTLQVAFLAIPGVLALFVSRRLFRFEPRNTLESFFTVFLFSVASYEAYDLTHQSLRRLLDVILDREASPSTSLVVVRLLENTASIRHAEVVGSAVFGVLLAYGVSAIHRFNLVSRLGLRIGATHRFGDEDVWHFFHNAPQTGDAGWVFVRDHKQQLVLYGWIAAWSDSGEAREIVLSEVDVFTNDGGEMLYSVQWLYLSRSPDELTIEVPRELQTQTASDAERHQEDEHGEEAVGQAPV